MNRLLLLLIGLLVCFGAEAQSLKIISFNIRFGERADMKRIAQTIEREKPDLVALQEVDVLTCREGTVAAGSADYPALLAAYTGMEAVFGRTIHFRGGQYGVAILSGMKILETSNDLYRHQGEEARTALSVLVDAGSRRRVRFVCTHLDAYDPAVRLRQVEELCARYTDSEIPTVVAGDFNETPDGTAIARFDKSFMRVCGEERTFPAEAPTEKIDYIGFAPVSAFRAGPPRVIDTSDVSDHRAVAVTLRFNGD